MTDPAKPDRNQRRRERSREAIVTAAGRVFRRKGFDATTVSDVTDEADVAYGTFYNHFNSLDEVAVAAAEKTLEEIATKVAEIAATAERVELLPFIGSRALIRILVEDQAIEWLIERPHVFVQALHKKGGPYMRDAERDAVASGIFRPAGGLAALLRTMPWILISELNSAVRTGEIASHESSLARMFARLLGIDDALVPDLLERSRALVLKGGLPEPSGRGSKEATENSVEKALKRRPRPRPRPQKK